MLKSLSHKNIIPFHDFLDDEPNGIFFIITDYFPYPSLKPLILDKTTSFELKMEVFDQIMDVLHYLHSKNVVHKDLKVENILFNADSNQIKLIDFGISQKFSEEDECLSPLEGSLASRPPSGICHGWGFSDLWNAFLIYFSLKENENVKTKKLLEILKFDQDEKTVLMKLRAFFNSLMDKEKDRVLTSKDFNYN